MFCNIIAWTVTVQAIASLHHGGLAVGLVSRGRHGPVSSTEADLSSMHEDDWVDVSSPDQVNNCLTN